MDSDLDQLTELAAHLYTANEITRVLVHRLEVREQARLRKAKQRHEAPTTLPTHSDSDPRQRIAI